MTCISKKLEKTLKKVLTREKRCDIINELSLRETSEQHLEN